MEQDAGKTTIFNIILTVFQSTARTRNTHLVSGRKVSCCSSYIFRGTTFSNSLLNGDQQAYLIYHPALCLVPKPFDGCKQTAELFSACHCHAHFWGLIIQGKMGC